MVIRAVGQRAGTQDATVSGMSAFQQTKIGVNVTFNEQVIDPAGTRNEEDLARANYKPLIVDGLLEVFPEVTERRPKNRLYKLVSNGGMFELGQMVVDDPSLIGTTQTVWLPA